MDPDNPVPGEVKTPIPLEFRWIMFGVIVVNSFLTYFYEKVVIWYLTLWQKNRSDRKKARIHEKQLDELRTQAMSYNRSDSNLTDNSPTKKPNPYPKANPV